MKTSTHSQTISSETITINTLRERATEMLRVADHLEATQKFIGNGVSSGTGITSPGPRLVTTRRKMSAAARKKIAAASKARWAKQKAVQTKTAAA